MSKSNIRSFRYSDHVASILEGFEGESMNAKFENLVNYCHAAVPKREHELKLLQEQIELKQKAYYDLCKQMQDVQQLINTLQTLQHYGEIASRKAEMIAKDLDHRGLPKKKAV